MSFKRIETSREIRLWLTQVVLPVVTVVMLVPEARKTVVTKIKKVKKNVETKFTKK